MNSLTLALFVAVAVAHASAGIVTGHGTPAIISGPSGTVVRSGAGVVPAAYGHGLYGPGLYGHGTAGVVVAPAVSAGAVISSVSPGYIAPGYGLAGLHGLYSPGYEGQYVPDHSELLYDDGSYKPYLYGH